MHTRSPLLLAAVTAFLLQNAPASAQGTAAKPAAAQPETADEEEEVLDTEGLRIIVKKMRGPKIVLAKVVKLD